MHRTIARSLAAAAAGTAVLAAAGCSTYTDAGNGAMGATEADENRPGLRVGDTVPPVSLTDADGNPVPLSSLYEDQPLVLTFYRGGWCPFCTRELKDWREHVDEVRELGARFVAVTPESADEYARTIDKNDLNYTVLGDPNHQAAKAFDVHFVVDQATRDRYANYGIDVAANNASDTWELPHPGTFIVDTEGVVRYAWVDRNYKKRADPEDVIAALRNISG